MPVYIRAITTVKDNPGLMPVTTSVPVMTLQLVFTDVCAGTVKLCKVTTLKKTKTCFSRPVNALYRSKVL